MIAQSSNVKIQDYKIQDPENIELRNRGIPIVNLNIIIPIKYPECSFLYVRTYDKNEYNEYLYFADDVSSLIEDTYSYTEKGEEIYSINLENRKFCIELTMESLGYLYINFITTIPGNCKNYFCKGLNGLFQALYFFLSSIDYTKIVLLKDDAQVNGKFLLYERIINNQIPYSIYSKYGFEISPLRLADIEQAYKNNDLQVLKIITRNVPMVAPNINNFGKCDL